MSDTVVVVEPQAYTVEVSNPQSSTMVVQDERVNIITQGTQGPAGGGMPAGGVSGALARKNSSANLDIGWSGVVVDSSDAISGYRASINTQTGTSYSLQSSDAGKLIRFTSASPVTMTLPNALPSGFNCSILQSGTGQVTCTPAVGATLFSSQGFTKTSGQYAIVTLIIDQNTSNNARYILGGDGA